MGQLRPESMLAKAIKVMFFLTIIFRCLSATNHTVGGPSGWVLGSDVKNWASKTVFVTGDNLVFVYKQDQNVIEVGEQGYAQCQIGNPIHKYVGGDTVIPLTNPGARYFVCGKPISRCFQGLKVQINVLPNKTVSDATAPIGSDDQAKSPDATTDLCHRHGPPQSPRPSDNCNGALAEKDEVGFLVHYLRALVVSIVGMIGSFAVYGYCNCMDHHRRTRMPVSHGSSPVGGGSRSGESLR